MLLGGGTELPAPAAVPPPPPLPPPPPPLVYALAGPTGVPYGDEDRGGGPDRIGDGRPRGLDDKEPGSTECDRWVAGMPWTFVAHLKVARCLGGTNGKE